MPGEHSVTWQEGANLHDVAVRAEHRDTMLTAFFKLNALNEPEIQALARCYLYQEITQRFRWMDHKRKWQRYVHNTYALACMYYVGFNQGEKFYLRMLLTVVRGPTSFEDVCTFEGRTYATFKECCIAHRMLEDDGEWNACLTEAALVDSGHKTQKLFAMILTACEPLSPVNLWNTHKEHLCEDLQHRLAGPPFMCPNASQEDAYDYGLFLIQHLIEQAGGSMQALNMPVCVQEWADEMDEPNCLLCVQQELINHQDPNLAATMLGQLNDQQCAASETATQSVLNKEGRCSF